MLRGLAFASACHHGCPQKGLRNFQDDGHDGKESIIPENLVKHIHKNRHIHTHIHTYTYIYIYNVKFH